MSVNTWNSWINKRWYIHLTEHYSAVNGKEILTLATTRMNLGDRVKSLSQKATCYVISFT